MSNVTNVLVLTAGYETAMAALTERREGVAWTGYFGDLGREPAAELWGHDGKWPECRVWAGAFNHLNRPALLQGLPRGEVTADLWCREVPLEGCSPCPGPIPVSSVRT